MIVIDALDECIKVAGREGGNIIPLIVSGILQAPGRVKLLVTSREEPEIMRMFRQLGLKKTENIIRLHQIEDTVVEGDIKTYYEYYFALISQRAGFEDADSWPSKADLDLLIKRTGKLFVFAALVIRLLSDLRIDPKYQLEEILRPSTD